MLNSLPQPIHKSCLRSLSRMCGRQALLPKSLEIPLCYDPMETPRFSSEFVDVWKGQYNSRDVVAKVLRVHVESDFRRIRKKFCKEVVTWKILGHSSVLPLIGVTIIENRFVTVSEWMKNGNINEFLREHADINPLELLEDAIMGLIYMHDQGIIHGNLKGANILINHNGHACVSDLSLLAVTSDPRIFVSSCIGSGKIPWMSPELLDPVRFGLMEGRPTKQSDCYALGMVVYEVLSGEKPYTPFEGPALLRKVLGSEPPDRPQGAQGEWLTDSIWLTLRLCWSPHPDGRPGLEAVLLCLQGSTQQWRSSYGERDIETDTSGQSDYTTTNDSVPSITHLQTQSPGIYPRPTLQARSPSTNTSLAIPHHDSQLQNPSQTSNRRAGRIGARRIFRVATRKLCGL